MSDYYGDSTLEDWLAREVFYVEEVHPEIVKRFEEWREGIENDIERWMGSDDGDGNPLSWRGWGRGFSSISDEDMLRFESLVDQSLLQLAKGDFKTPPKKESTPPLPFNEIRRLQEVEKQYRNYRNTIREMLNNGELVYKK